MRIAGIPFQEYGIRVSVQVPGTSVSEAAVPGTFRAYGSEAWGLLRLALAWGSVQSKAGFLEG